MSRNVTPALSTLNTLKQTLKPVSTSDLLPLSRPSSTIETVQQQLRLMGARVPVHIHTLDTTSMDNHRMTVYTLQQMKELAIHDAVVALQLSGIGQRGYDNLDHLGKSIWQYVRQTIKYVEEPDEIVVAPSLLLTSVFPMGDCDDFATTISSILTAYNIPNWFVVVKTISREWEHVLNMIQLEDGTFRYIDSSEGPVYGWLTENISDMGIYQVL